MSKINRKDEISEDLEAKLKNKFRLITKKDVVTSLLGGATRTFNIDDYLISVGALVFEFDPTV